MDQPSSTESNALTLRIKFKSASLEEFISRYGVDVSPGGIFIRTRQPVDVGTSLQFEFSLADGSALLAGLGTVAWVRENDPARANNVPGMGLRFDKLTLESQQNHQTILAEKARKEGKPQGTPYPPTAFVAPATRPSPASEVTRAAPPPAPPSVSEAVAKGEPAPVNFAKTLPAPAALASRLQQVSLQQSGEFGVDDFDGGGKTEISDKPIDYFIQEAEAAQKAEAAAPAPRAVSGGEVVAKADLGDWKNDVQTLEGVNAPPAPEEVSITDSQAYATSAPEPSPVKDSGERRPSDKDFFTSMLDTEDTSEVAADSKSTQPGKGEDSSSGVPLEEAVPEKTEELSLSGARLTDEAVEAVDLGGATAENEAVEAPIPSLGDFSLPEKKRRRGGLLLVGGVLAAGAAAFAAVYLLQTKPWQSPGTSENPALLVKKTSSSAAALAPAPTAQPEPAKPAAESKPAALAQAVPEKAAKEDKPTAQTEKPAVIAEKSAGEKKADEKAAAAEKRAEAKAAAEKAAAEKKEQAKAAAEQRVEEKAAEEKAAAEKKAQAKAAAEQAAAEKKEAASKAGGKAKSGKGAATASGEAAEKAAASEQEEVYRLSFRSVPIGAEVLIDGEYFARTPCERRILDPKKTLAVTIRKEGYEPHERMIGSSDNWAKKGDGHERVLSISVNLKKSNATEPAAPSKVEEKPAIKTPPEEPDKI